MQICVNLWPNHLRLLDRAAIAKKNVQAAEMGLNLFSFSYLFKVAHRSISLFSGKGPAFVQDENDAVIAGRYLWGSRPKQGGREG